MSFVSSVRKFLKGEKVSGNSKRNDVPKEDPSTNPPETPLSLEDGFEFLDGMSTGTARFIIDREVTGDVLEKYEIKDLENKGRYYLAKLVDTDGKVTDTALIDKMNRKVHFQKGKFNLS